MPPDPEFERWMADLDIEVPEFNWPTNSLTRCALLLPEAEQVSILEAATMASNGYCFEAEAARVRGGYGFHARKADRHRRGLPQTFDDSHIERGDN